MFPLGSAASQTSNAMPSQWPVSAPILMSRLAGQLGDLYTSLTTELFNWDFSAHERKSPLFQMLFKSHAGASWRVKSWKRCPNENLTRNAGWRTNQLLTWNTIDEFMLERFREYLCLRSRATVLDRFYGARGHRKHWKQKGFPLAY